MSLMLRRDGGASNVRQVKAKPSDAKRLPDAAGRKARAERLIIRHFHLGVALYAGVVGLAEIVGAGTAARGAAYRLGARRFGAWRSRCGARRT